MNWYVNPYSGHFEGLVSLVWCPESVNLKQDAEMNQVYPNYLTYS